MRPSRTRQGESVIDSTEAYFDGNSQGHIMGGAATAVSTEWTKAVLGVGGMNYSLLLDRSVDFDSYFVILRGAYPDRLDQLVLYGVIQMLWDRSETNGYAQHLGRDPYPGTPDHQVLVHVAFGDHQVATWSAEIQARTMGAVLRGPALADGRHPDAQPFFGLEVADEVPAGASALVYWDSGTLPPPLGNLTPRAGEAWQAECGALREDQWKASAVRRQPRGSPSGAGVDRPEGRLLPARRTHHRPVRWRTVHGSQPLHPRLLSPEEPMTAPIACLTSVEAFLAAPPDELAAAVMTCGLGGTVAVRPLDRRVEVIDVVLAVGRALQLADLKPGVRLHQAMQQPPLSEIADAITEGILFGEQRFCLARSVTTEGADQVRLLRRGRAALVAGDPFTYLR
jgi:hypothetical protein